MPLPNDFPEKALLEKEGFDSVEAVSEASDDELLAIEGIAAGRLAKIRDVAPHKPSPDEVGPGATSGRTDSPGKAKTSEAPEGSVDPTAESYEAQTSKKAKDQTDPVTGEPLPEGVTKNERGTLTASSEVDQNDMVSPQQVKDERDAALRREGEKISALLGSTNR